MAIDRAQYEMDLVDFFSRLPKSSFEKAHCPFCGPKKKPAVMFTKGPMRVVRCPCWFVYNEWQPTQKALNEFYRQSDAMTKWAKIKRSKPEAKRQVEKFGSVIKHLKKTKPDTLLDIGCGTGKFLSLLSEELPEIIAYGCDENEESLKVARKAGLAVFRTSASEIFRHESVSVDCITLWGVLEHVKDPVGLLKSCKKILEPGGQIIVCVPNVDSEVVTTLWRDCFTFQPTHLWYFNKHTLKLAMDQAGLRALKTETIEPEVRPSLRFSHGFSPYEKHPHWVEKRLHEHPHTARNVTALGLGYKIITVGEKT